MCMEVVHELEWYVLFPYLCFEIWESHNGVIFNHEPINLDSIISMAKKTSLGYEKKYVYMTQPTQLDEVLSESPPLRTPSDFYLHTDTSFVSDKKPMGLGCAQGSSREMDSRFCESHLYSEEPSG